MNNYNERVGTRAANSLFAASGDIAYAGPGDDQIFLGPATHAYLIGGSGNDTYLLGGASYAVILDSSGHDTIVAPFRIEPASTFAVTVDGGRHLILGDSNTETLILVMDSQKHPIETFSFLNFTTSRDGMEYVIRENGMHMGDVSFKQREQFGFGSESFWSLGVQAEIDYILSREVELFEPSSEGNPGVTPAPEPGPTPEAEPVTSNAALVDADWYLSQNPDVAAAGIDASTHYMQWGWQEGRDPNSLFDTDWYLLNYPDVAAAQINPLDHYLHYGWQESRNPSEHFDTNSYLEHNPDVALAGINPLEHYMNWGLLEGREF